MVYKRQHTTNGSVSTGFLDGFSGFFGLSLVVGDPAPTVVARPSPDGYPTAMTTTPRAGFTAIELLVVLIVVLVLIGMAVPALLGSMRKGSVNDAANAVIRVSSQARQFARTRSLVAAAVGYYGLTIASDNGQTYVALTYGTDAKPATILMQPATGKPVSKLLLNRNVLAYTGDKYDPDGARPLENAQSVGWLYQYRTGYPIVDATTTAKCMNIGVDPEHPVAAPPEVPRAQFPNALRHLSFRTADGRYRTAIAVYQIGLSNVQDF